MDHFGTEQGLTDYATAMGLTPATGDKNAALVRASVYLGYAYEDRFVGTRTGGQFLSWPRSGAAYPDGTAVTGIPEGVVLATYEAALLELASPGALTPVVTPGKVKRRTRVEGAVDVEYFRDWASADLVAGQYPISPRVESYLVGLIGLRWSLPGVAIV